MTDASNLPPPIPEGGYAEPEPIETETTSPVAEVLTARTTFYLGHLRYGQLLYDIPAPKPLIDGMIDLESLAFLYGEPKSYKSFLALDWALCVAHGLPWNGHEVSKQKVLYVAAEGASGIPERVKAWMKRRLPAEPLPTDDFMLLKVPVPMGSAIDSDAISGIAVTLGIKFVVLDTLARCSAGMDENSTKDMGMLVSNADAIKANSGAAVLFVHHSGKSDKNDLRGSSSLKGAADSVFRLKRSGNGELKLANSEQKNHAEAAETILLVKPIGDSVVLECPNKAQVLTEPQRKAVDALVMLTAEHGPVRLADWARACGVEQVSNAVKRPGIGDCSFP